MTAVGEMPSDVIFGLALALACALTTSASFLLKQRRGLGAARARLAPAAKRHRALPLQVVRGGLAGGGRSLGASRRRPCLSSAVDRASCPLSRAGLPRRARRAVLWFPPRSPAVDWCDHHGSGACCHRAYPGVTTRRNSALRTSRLDHRRMHRPSIRHGACRGGWPPPRPAGKGGRAPRRRRRRAVRHFRRRASSSPTPFKAGCSSWSARGRSRQWPPR
jgi:hypothetical protein